MLKDYYTSRGQNITDGGLPWGWEEGIVIIVNNSNIKNIFQMPPANLNRMKEFPQISTT